MKAIWKYEITPTTNYLLMPIGSEIMSVQTLNNAPCLWAIVGTEEKKEDRYFEIFGTGHELRGDMGVDRKFIGTFQIHEDCGILVFHLFERL